MEKKNKLSCKNFIAVVAYSYIKNFIKEYGFLEDVYVLPDKIHKKKFGDIPGVFLDKNKYKVYFEIYKDEYANIECED